MSSQLQLQDVRHVANIMGLVILEHINGLIISTAGTVKNDEVWEVADTEDALSKLKEIQRERHPLN